MSIDTVMKPLEDAVTTPDTPPGTPVVFDQALTYFLRNPLMDRFTSLSKAHLNDINTQCSIDYKQYCSTIPSSQYDLTNTLSTNQYDNEHKPCHKLRGLLGFSHHHHQQRSLTSLSNQHYDDHHDGHHDHDHRNEDGHHDHPHDHSSRDPRVPIERIQDLSQLALGYGPYGDKCLTQSFQSLSSPCQFSLLNLQDLQHQYWDETTPLWDNEHDFHHHPHFGGLFIVLTVLLTSLFCCFRCCQIRSRSNLIKEQSKAIITAIQTNPALKTTVENATGLSVPNIHNNHNISSFFNPIFAPPAPIFTRPTPIYNGPTAPPMERIPIGTDCNRPATII
jgi:hypothetical protein